MNVDQLDYSTTPEERRAALENVRARELEEFRRMQQADPLVRFLISAIEDSERRRRHYLRHHPRPLPIDGHAYARRRAHRRRVA